MKTKIKVAYTFENSVFEMEISDIKTEEEFKTAKNDIRREMKYFIQDMKDKMPKTEKEKPIKEEEKVEPNEYIEERKVPSEKQISTLHRHNIHEVNGVPVEQIDKDVASKIIKDIFAKKQIQPTYTMINSVNNTHEEIDTFPEEDMFS